MCLQSVVKRGVIFYDHIAHIVQKLTKITHMLNQNTIKQG